MGVQNLSQRANLSCPTRRETIRSSRISQQRIPQRRRKISWGVRAVGEAAAVQSNPIALSEDALKHLRRLREDSGDADLLLRVGVKAGGCSGMSYTMDFEDGAKVTKEDTIMEYDGFRLVSDAMSLLYLFGMTLDYSNKLIGGGFIFQNPNAQSSCGCGKSFGM